MIINLLGNLIDTSMIYRISGLREPNKHRFNDSGGSNDDPIDWMTSFTIHFLNKKSMKVSTGTSKEEREELKRILDDLVSTWTRHQISIKTIDTKEDKYGNISVYVD